jgi:putative transposase
LEVGVSQPSEGFKPSEGFLERGNHPVKYVDDEYYHIFNRGANKARIFFIEENYSYCFRLLKKYSLQQNVAILAYCLMPNHYHLVCRQDAGGSISKFLQTTFNAYSQAVNKQQGHSGTLFEGKAQAKHINSDSYVLQVIRYLHLNPVEARLVMKPEEWRYSDYGDWIAEPSEGFKPSEGLGLRNAYFKKGTAYREFVETYKEEKDKAGIKEYLFNE